MVAIAPTNHLGAFQLVEPRFVGAGDHRGGDGGQAGERPRELVAHQETHAAVEVGMAIAGGRGDIEVVAAGGVIA